MTMNEDALGTLVGHAVRVLNRLTLYVEQNNDVLPLHLLRAVSEADELVNGVQDYLRDPEGEA